MQNGHYTLTFRLRVRHDGELVGAQMFSDAHSMAVDHLVDSDLLQEVVDAHLDAVYQVISGEAGGRPWPEIDFRGDPSLN